MDPKVWGDSGWVVMYAIANGYPDQPTPRDIHHYLQFYRYIQAVLPCHACSLHYSEHLTKIPIDPFMNSRTELLTWVNQVHNAVCRQLGKPPVPRDQIDERYLRRGQTKWLYYWWRFMFAVSYAYPDRPKMDDIYHYQRFILALQYVLPRKADRDRYMTILSANPVNRYLITPKYLNRWLIAVHNQFVAKQQINSEKQAYQVYFDRPDNQLQDPAKPAIIDTFIAGGKDTLFIAAGILTILSLLIGSHKSLT